MLLWLLVQPAVQDRTLHLDIAHSHISFQVAHMGFLRVEGNFSAFEVALQFSEQQAQVTSVIDVRSIDTDEPTRDTSLLGKGYLDADQFPHITFRSTSFHFQDTSQLIHGQLTIKGETRAISIPIEMDTLSDASVYVQGQLSISRAAFLLDFGAMDALIGDEINIQLDLRFD